MFVLDIATLAPEAKPCNVPEATSSSKQDPDADFTPSAASADTSTAGRLVKTIQGSPYNSIDIDKADIVFVDDACLIGQLAGVLSDGTKVRMRLMLQNAFNKCEGAGEVITS